MFCTFDELLDENNDDDDEDDDDGLDFDCDDDDDKSDCGRVNKNFPARGGAMVRSAVGV